MKYYKGYIALSTVLITLALVILIGVSTSLLSINDLLSSDSGQKSNTAVNLVEACVEDALLQLNSENSIDPSIILPNGNCSVTIISNTGGFWDFTVSTDQEGFYKSVRVKATVGEYVSVNSWLDV